VFFFAFFLRNALGEAGSGKGGNVPRRIALRVIEALAPGSPGSPIAHDKTGQSSTSRRKKPLWPLPGSRIRVGRQAKRYAHRINRASLRILLSCGTVCDFAWRSGRVRVYFRGSELVPGAPRRGRASQEQVSCPVVYPPTQDTSLGPKARGPPWHGHLAHGTPHGRDARATITQPHPSRQRSVRKDMGELSYGRRRVPRQTTEKGGPSPLKVVL